MENTEKEKNVYELLKKLSDLECNNAKIEAIIFAKKGSRLVSNKVNDMQECIVENAKEYGKKIEFINETLKIKNAIEANIIRNYTLSLEKVNKQFDIKYKTILEKSLELKNKECEALMVQDYITGLRNEAQKKPEYLREKSLQEQAKIAIDEGNYEELEKINEELREISKVNKATKYENQVKHVRVERAKIAEAIKRCEEEIKACEEDRRKAIELIAGRKEDLLQTADKKYLVVLQEQSWIQKTMGKILNKLNGNKRYTENVTNVLSKKVRDVDYKAIPALRTKLQKETEGVMSKVHEITGDVKEIASDLKELYAEKKDKTKEEGKKYAIKGIDKTSQRLKYVGDKTQRITNKGKEKITKVGKKTWEASKQTYNAMIGKYRSARMWTITKMQERITTLENKNKTKTQEQENIR